MDETHSPAIHMSMSYTAGSGPQKGRPFLRHVSTPIATESKKRTLKRKLDKVGVKDTSPNAKVQKVKEKLYW